MVDEKGGIPGISVKQRWGPWEYRREKLTLQLNQPGRGSKHPCYEVDLERAATSPAMLDWIFQIRNKTWATPEIMWHLLAAFDELLDPQSAMCSQGMKGSSGKKIDPVRVLRAPFAGILSMEKAERQRIVRDVASRLGVTPEEVLKRFRDATKG